MAPYDDSWIGWVVWFLLVPFFVLIIFWTLKLKGIL